MISAIEKLRKWLDYKVNRFDQYRNTIVLNTGAHPDELYDIVDEIETTYMQLPLDVDGVPIRPGDLIECEYMMHGPMTVANVGRYDVYAYNELEKGFFIAAVCHHVKQDTVESILREFTEESLKWACQSGFAPERTSWTEMSSEYIERIRKAM